MHHLLTNKKAEIDSLCRQYDVRSLAVFGSAARQSEFRTGQSDFDFLVTYRSRTKPDALQQYFGLRTGLEDLLGHPVDLVEEGAIVNPYLSAEIRRNLETVFDG